MAKRLGALAVNEPLSAEWAEYHRHDQQLRRLALVSLGIAGGLFLILSVALRPLVKTNPVLVVGLAGGSLFLLVVAALVPLIGVPLVRRRYHPNRCHAGERRYSTAALVLGPLALLALTMASAYLVPGLIGNVEQGKWWAMGAVLAFGVLFLLKPRGPH